MKGYNQKDIVAFIKTVESVIKWDRMQHSEPYQKKFTHVKLPMNVLSIDNLVFVYRPKADTHLLQNYFDNDLSN